MMTCHRVINHYCSTVGIVVVLAVVLGLFALLLGLSLSVLLVNVGLTSVLLF